MTHCSIIRSITVVIIINLTGSMLLHFAEMLMQLCEIMITFCTRNIDTRQDLGI